MDYGKSGNPKTDRNTPRFSAVPRQGAPKSPEDQAKAKAELLARMKAAAEARKTAE
jgi:hypothetical protein